ncbi:hypothetical protein G6M14_08570 [Agrobacterium tumefaciens]|uniref:SGNH/GDSL hydrolase family protein n=1 Tax=Agrobacterium tumefaciens TaxID=358 RepID=UPI00157282CC|nr:hypothetical protein [Agrobacterium tumefaciens]
MAENPYPIPRQLRQSGILVGDGGDTYGPFDFSIFDPEDVFVFIREENEPRFKELNGVVITKVNGNSATNALDKFTFKAPENLPATTRYLVLSSRLAARAAGVISGTRLDPTALEKELSKIAAQQQEQHRDLGRSWKSDFGQPGMTMDADLSDGDTFMKLGDRIVKGPKAHDIAHAQEYAADAKVSKEAAEISAAQAQAAEEHAVEVTETLQAEVTAAIDEMETKLEGAAEGLVSAAAWSQLVATPGTRIGQPGRVSGIDAGTHTDPVVGGTVPNGGAYRWSGSGWQRTGDAIDPIAIQSDLDQVRLKANNDVTSVSSPTLQTKAATVSAARVDSISAWSPADFSGWTFTWSPSEIMIVDSFEPFLNIGVTVSYLELRVWQRPIANSASATAMGSLDGDREVYSRTIPVAEVSEAIGVFKHVRIDISSLGLVLPGFIYGAELIARTSGGAFAPIAGAPTSYTGTHPQWERGWIRTIAGNTGPVSPASRLTFRLNRSSARGIDTLQGNIAALADNFSSRSDIAVADTGFAGRYGLSNNFRGVQVGIEIYEPTIGTDLVIPFHVASDCAYVYLRVYQRRSDISTSAAFGNDPADIVVLDKLVLIADAGLAAGVAGTATIELSDLPVMQAGHLYGFELTGKTAAMTAAIIAMANTSQPSGSPQWVRGWYTTAAPPNWTAFNATTGLSARVNKAAFQAHDVPETPIAPALLSPDYQIRSQLGFTAYIPPVELRRPSGRVRSAGTILTFDAPVSSVRTGTLSLALQPTSGISPVLPTLDQYLTDVTLVRVSDGATLVQGTDYVVYPDQGAVGLPASGTPFDVNYTITGHSQRYDMVSFNPTTKAVVVTKGGDRVRDPDYYAAVAPAGNIPLYRAFITRYGVDLIPIMHHRRMLRDDLKSDYAARMAYNRSCLPKTLKSLRSGNAVKLIGYGDSITAIGGGGIEPDGAVRDMASWISGMPADTKATIPTYDGAGGLGAHIRVGWNWILKAALEARYSSTITYLNFGWSGTTSANSGNNGLNPARLNRILSEGPALMVLAFGMNELGSTSTYANVVNIIQQAKAAGMEVIVLTPPRCNEIGRSAVYDGWRKTHDDLVLAAIDTASAYVSTFEIAGKGFEGAMARSPKSMCMQNLYNHPWPLELAEIGRWLAQIFD